MMTDREKKGIPIRGDLPLDWDDYFMLQAMMASFKSKDPSTKVGAVFVDEHNHQITMGYNGFVAGIDESQLPWSKDVSVGLEHQKYGYVVHAEANAILHSPGLLAGSRAYVTLFPCHECAKLIASCKVSEVIYLCDKYDGEESNRVAKKIFRLAGIKTRSLSISSWLISNLKEHFVKLIEE
ncbi:MAG: dCMP deaminase family protein [Bacteriovoracales bacterium]|nr:dCMP deaminase family protein [Bacteriovoracales bacterium]